MSLKPNETKLKTDEVFAKFGRSDDEEWQRAVFENAALVQTQIELKNPAKALERKGWKAWYGEIFGQDLVDVLAEHHEEAIEWHWNARMAIIQGKRPPNDWFAYFPIWSRGNMKTTILRRLIIADACLSISAGIPAYALVVGGTKKKARGSAISIKSLLTLPQVKRYYPKLSKIQRNAEGIQTGYTAEFIHTEGGVFHFIGLDEGIAGTNVLDVRPTLIAPDDIDDREDSPVISENRFQTFTRAVLPTRQQNTLVFFAQNLISLYSVMYRIQSQQARVLTNRKPTVAIPAVVGLVTETQTVNGIVKDVVLAGKPTWKGWNEQRIQDEIDTYGLRAFMTECQHAVEQDREGLVLQNWTDSVHVITRSEFQSVYGTDILPQNWYKDVFNDWARTKTARHANVAGIVTVSSQNSRLPGVTFMWLPQSFKANTAPEDVAIRLLEIISPVVKPNSGLKWSDLLQDTLRKNNLTRYDMSLTDRMEQERSVLARIFPDMVRPILRAQNYRRFRGSHEQSKTGVLPVYQKCFGLPFVGTNPGGDGGIDMINLLMKVDYTEKHPFKADVMGRSNFYMVVDDGKEPFPTTLSPDDLHDSDLARFQFANCRWRDTTLTTAGEIEAGLLKINDDFLQGMMFLYYDQGPTAAPLKHAEKVEEAIPTGYRYQDLIEKSPHDGGLTPMQEMSYLINKGLAAKKVKSRVKQYNEYSGWIPE